MNIEELLESEAMAAPVNDLIRLRHAAIISTAISLKRIADAVGRGIADQIEEGLRRPINNYGEDIGSALQMQIIRGQRGIDY